jgi:hypothetical protein
MYKTLVKINGYVDNKKTGRTESQLGRKTGEQKARQATKQTMRLPAKLGIRNLSPHLRNSAILRTTKSIAELRTTKSCGTAIADLQNLTSAIPQLSAVSSKFRYFLVPNPQLRMV